MGVVECVCARALTVSTTAGPFDLSRRVVFPDPTAASISLSISFFSFSFSVATAAATAATAAALACPPLREIERGAIES